MAHPVLLTGTLWAWQCDDEGASRCFLAGSNFLMKWVLSWVPQADLRDSVSFKFFKKKLEKAGTWKTFGYEPNSITCCSWPGVFRQQTAVLKHLRNESFSMLACPLILSLFCWEREHQPNWLPSTDWVSPQTTKMESAGWISLVVCVCIRLYL